MIDIDTVIDRSPLEYRDALATEKRAYERIHDITKAVLAEVGMETRNETLVSILEATGLAGYDASVGRVYLLPDLIDRSLASAAKEFSGDEGQNTLGIGGIPPFLYREKDNVLRAQAGAPVVHYQVQGGELQPIFTDPPLTPYPYGKFQQPRWIK